MVVPNLDAHTRQRRADADNFFAARLDDALRGQCVAFHAKGFEGGAQRFECHGQRCLRHAIARSERISAKTPTPEPLTEPPLRFGADRLGAIEADAPGGQVHALEFVVTYALEAQVESEARRRRDSPPMPRDGPQPRARHRNEQLGRKQYELFLKIKNAEEISDQSHVVVERQPSDADGP